MDQSMRNQVFEDAKMGVFFKAVDAIVEHSAEEYRNYYGPSKADGLRNAFNKCAEQLWELMDAYKAVTNNEPPGIGGRLRKE